MRSALLFALLVASACARAPQGPPRPRVFEQISGRWTGTLEYADFRGGPRVRLPTELEAGTGERGRELALAFRYREPSGAVVRGSARHALDVGTGRYVIDRDTFAITTLEGFTAGQGGGRLVMDGRIRENGVVVPARQTLVLQGDTLRLLKETREPLQFRNEYRLVRAPEAPR